MQNLNGKKLLLLGGKPIGSCEIVEWAKEHGVYTIVADYLDENESPAKRIADENWMVSTADIDELAKLAKKARIDGVYSGVHEFNMRQMIKLCKLLRLPCYCTIEQWDSLENKALFKQACVKHSIPIAKEYSLDSKDVIDFPVIVKPADGSGSRGFSICRNYLELEAAKLKAESFSESRSVLIESLMDYRYSVIINYTIINGAVLYSGMSAKRSGKIGEKGAPIMSLQIYPSEYERVFLDELNEKTIDMIRDLGIKNGVIWIEAFCKDGHFTFNEMGFRFGGSLTYYPVRYVAGIDQLGLQVEYALTGKNDSPEKLSNETKHKLYCILPIHVRPGTIAEVCGLEKLGSKSYVKHIVLVHFKGDAIEEWGSAQQVFAYIHFVCEEKNKIETIEKDILNTLHVFDEKRENMLFDLFDSSLI